MILKLKPACKDYLWGGHRLAEEYGIEYDGKILAEAWELSCHPDGPSIITNGKYAGKTLREFLEIEGLEVLGTHCRRFREFPILTKFIDAKDNLSIQVHPNNNFALQNEGQFGKSEMWYILDAEPGAFLYYGFKKEISKEEFARRIKENTLLEVLNAVPVKKGDALFIESGTLHAIGKGILIAEIQQNSNVTYRVYDYGRVGADGKKRDLHIEKALAVTNRVPIVKSGTNYPHVADCDYFTVDKLNLDGDLTHKIQGNVRDTSFLSILILDGEGVISNRDEKISYKKGDSLFLTAGSGDWQIEGVCDALLTTIREKAGSVRVGVDINSSEMHFGIVTDRNELLDVKKFPTEPTRSVDEIIEDISEKILELLKEENIPLEQCTGIGIGFPGTIDRREGKVIYSNNIKWKDVELAKKIGEKIPCPIRIANDADCAALGEAITGAGKNHSDVVMFTLGSGVGGGIIINGEVFEGGNIGGGEVGHQVIKIDGAKCSCGRNGCLEAYISVPALLKNAEEIFARKISLDEIFKLYTEKNSDAEKIISQYTKILGQGIANVVNIFRPQIIILGGDMTKYLENLIEPIKNSVQENCFGGNCGVIPEIIIAELGNNAGMIGAANL